MVRFAHPSSSPSSSSDPQPPAIPFSIDDILQDERKEKNFQHREQIQHRLTCDPDASDDEFDPTSNLPADLSSSRPSNHVPPINPPPRSFDLSSFRFYHQQQHARESFMSVGGSGGADLQQHRQQQLHDQQRLQFNPNDAASSLILGSNVPFDGHHSLSLPHRQSVLGCGRDR